MSPTRSFISRAALLVKVTARISHGRARPVARMWAMRVVSTRVLPVPAPASTSTGPSERLDRLPLLGVEAVEIAAPGGAAPRPRGNAAGRGPGGCGGRIAGLSHRVSQGAAFAMILTVPKNGTRPRQFTRGSRGACANARSGLLAHRDAAAGASGTRQMRVRGLHAGERRATSSGKGAVFLRRHVDMQRHVLGGGRNPAFGRHGRAARNSASAWRRNRGAETSPAPGRRRAVRAGSAHALRR